MISLNEKKAQHFLAQNKITNYSIVKIAGDASFRSYYRIFLDKKNFILMFAPPSHERIDHFIAIDKFLYENNFSAPEIIAIDEKEGFILLEDFGDETYGRVLAKNSSQELALYKNACDCLIELHKIAPPSGLETYNHALLFREVMLFVDWYLPHIKKTELTLAQKSQFKNLWFDIFDLLSRDSQILVLRDYHADNLMILPERKNYKSVGLLDFQDAVIGSKAYDLVSLLEDARRDVAKKTQDEVLQYYVNKTNIDEKNFVRDYKILSLQRNIKIVGIFARLAIRDSKPHYLNLLPRVVGHIIIRLESSESMFKELAQFLKKFV